MLSFSPKKANKPINTTTFCANMIMRILSFGASQVPTSITKRAQGSLPIIKGERTVPERVRKEEESIQRETETKREEEIAKGVLAQVNIAILFEQA